MIDLGLTRAQQKALLRTLASDHKVDVRVSLLDMEHRSLGRLDGRVTGGQVNIDADADVTRQLQMTFIDEKGQVDVDTEDGRPELRRMIQVHYRVFVEDVIDDWVPIPIFTGPVTGVSREGAKVSLEAMGKEHLILGPTWRSKTYRKGRYRVDVVRSILRSTGERRMRLPKGWRSRTSRAISMKKEDKAWAQCQAISSSMRSQLFYDGRGAARMRKWPVRSSMTFKDGDGGMLLSIPKVEQSTGDTVNIVRVVGAVPTGKKDPLIASATLHPSHPYSPQSLGRHGVQRYLPEQIDDDTLRTQKEVERAARRRLTEVQLDEQLVKFDSLPMPLLEEGDRFTVDSRAVKAIGRISQMTIPLGHDGVSTIGYLAPASRRKRR